MEGTRVSAFPRRRSPTMVSVEGWAPGVGYTHTMPWYSAQGSAVAQVRPEMVPPLATCGMLVQSPVSPSNVHPASAQAPCSEKKARDQHLAQKCRLLWILQEQPITQG